MTITKVTPILFADGLEDVTYRCKGCCSEMKRTFKRLSGEWQRIRHTPEFPSLQRFHRLPKPLGQFCNHSPGVVSDALT